MSRRAIVTALAAGILIVAGSLPAWGTNVVKIRSKVTIASDGPIFHGHVRSPRSACVEGRKVKLKRVISGGPDQVMGTSTTNANGRWRVTVSGFAGISLAHFYAHVRRRAEGTAGTIFVCRPDRSRTIMLED